MEKKKKQWQSRSIYTVCYQSEATSLGFRHRLQKQLRDLLQQIKFIVIKMSWQKFSGQPETHIFTQV